MNVTPDSFPVGTRVVDTRQDSHGIITGWSGAYVRIEWDNGGSHSGPANRYGSTGLRHESDDSADSARHDADIRQNVTGQWQAHCRNRRCVFVSLPYARRAEAVESGERHGVMAAAEERPAQRGASPGVVPSADTSDDIAAAPVPGQRVSIPVHTDSWMRGYRYGTVVRVYPTHVHVRATDAYGSRARTIRLPRDEYGDTWGRVDGPINDETEGK